LLLYLILESIDEVSVLFRRWMLIKWNCCYCTLLREHNKHNKLDQWTVDKTDQLTDGIILDLRCLNCEEGEEVKSFWPKRPRWMCGWKDCRCCRSWVESFWLCSRNRLSNLVGWSRLQIFQCLSTSVLALQSKSFNQLLLRFKQTAHAWLAFGFAVLTKFSFCRLAFGMLCSIAANQAERLYMLIYQFMCCSALKLCSPAAALSAGISRNTGPEAKRKEKLQRVQLHA